VKTDNQISSEIPRSKAKAIFQTMLMSDQHLESSNAIHPEFPVVAASLILAGNRCFYEGEYENCLQQLRELDNLDRRIHFLQNKSYLLPNSVRILGLLCMMTEL
jgi:hypothetical protein